MNWTELAFSGIKGAISSLTIKKMDEPILMTFMVYSITLGLRRGPLGCWMVDPLPLEGDEVGQIRKN